MDQEAKLQQLENEKSVLEQYLQHPVTKEFLNQLDDNIESCERMVCDVGIVDVETFFKHFEVVGQLKTLRQTKALLLVNLEDIKAQIKETRI